MMPQTERPAFQDELDADLSQVVEYIALSYLAEEVSFIAAPLRRILVAYLTTVPESSLTPYRRHLRDVLGSSGRAPGASS